MWGLGQQTLSATSGSTLSYGKVVKDGPKFRSFTIMGKLFIRVSQRFSMTTLAVMEDTDLSCPGVLQA